MSKETWIIEPHDSLIFRDGRPFNNTAGSRAKSLDFPFPSTLIGSVRTRVGLENGGDWINFSQDLIDKIQKIKMLGALLAEKKNNNLEFFAPAPADSLYIKPEKDGGDNLFPLIPLAKGYLSNITDNLHLLGVKEVVKGKPISEIRFWHWHKFAEWLIEAETQKITGDKLGIGGLVTDQRTHVKIDYERKSNIDGGLFQTRGLEFTTKDRKRLVLALQVDYGQEFHTTLAEGVFPLGGERRIVRWEKHQGADFENEFANLKSQITAKIKQSEAGCHCRLILLTPAYFEDGFLPKSLNAEVKAVAVNRPQVISGWDFALKKPKPTRRLAPAGTVYFLKINGDVEKFIEEVWFKNIGDCEQSKRDGFGLAIPGSWDGKYHEI